MPVDNRTDPRCKAAVDALVEKLRAMLHARYFTWEEEAEIKTFGIDERGVTVREPSGRTFIRIVIEPTKS